MGCKLKSSKFMISHSVIGLDRSRRAGPNGISVLDPDGDPGARMMMRTDIDKAAIAGLKTPERFSGRKDSP